MAEKKETKKKTGFTKGHVKMGGRQKGTKNKVTRDLRQLIKDKLADHIEKLDQIIEDIKDPAQKAAALAQWTQYVIPKYSNTTISDDTRRDIGTEEFLKELNDNYKKADIEIDITKVKIVNNG